MKTANLALAITLAILITFSILSSSSQFASAKDGSQKVRVIAESEYKAAEAVGQGCEIVRETKGLKALVCSSDVASKLGLQEDIKVFAVDAGANSQIGANTVQASGDTGSGRKIVVLDTGYNYLHPELSSSYVGGKDFVNNDSDPMDDNGHGSHVAGLITGDGVKSGAKGVAPDATIISGKVLASSGSGYFSDIVAAVYWAVDGPDGISGTSDDFGADAISMSLGTSPPYTYKGTCDNVMPSMTNAIKHARDNGVLVIVAAGNSGNSGVSLPGCISYSTTVGAVNSLDKIASFSGRGKAVDIVAPGVSLYSAWTGASYVSASGTSMATPVVSGTVALIKVAHPTYTPSQVESALFNTAKDLGKLGKDNNYGYGRINASAAVG
ncbi:MAG TPA: S8 family serine peptidase [Nitrososphaera sp.]|nr:S8 family serine peptidase [Nitrososphaera sp.]